MHWNILNKNGKCWRSKILLNLNRPIKTVEMKYYYYYYEMVPVNFYPSVDECQHFFLIKNNLMSKPPTDAIAVNRKWMRIKYNKINSNWQSFIYASKSQIYKWCSIFVLAWIRVEWSDITVWKLKINKKNIQMKRHAQRFWIKTNKIWNLNVIWRVSGFYYTPICPSTNLLRFWQV